MKKLIEVLQDEENKGLAVSIGGSTDLIIVALHSIIKQVAKGLGISMFQLVMHIAAAAINEEDEQEEKEEKMEEYK